MPGHVIGADGGIKDSGGVAPQGVVVRAYRANSYTSAGTYEALKIDTKEFDPFNWFDVTTHRFTPKIAGYYRVGGKVLVDLTGGQAFLMVRKNGVSNGLGRGWQIISGNQAGGTASELVYLNGTTDYVDLGLYTDALKNINGSGYTSFDAELVGTAVGIVPRWPMIADLDTVNSYTFAGLSGDSDRGYQLIVDGRVTLNGSGDNTFWVRLTGVADSSNNGRNTGAEVYNTDTDTNVGPTYYEPASDAGLWLGTTRWGLDSDFLGKMEIKCHSSQRPLSTMQASTKPNAVDPRTMQYTGGGMLYTARNVTAIQIILGASAARFTGRMSLRRLDGATF